MRIMAHTDGIAAHFFELFKAAYPDFFCNGGTECTGIVVNADPLNFHGDFIQKESIIGIKTEGADTYTELVCKKGGVILGFVEPCFECI